MNETLRKFQTMDLAQLLHERPQIVPEGVWLTLYPKTELLLTRYRIEQQSPEDIISEAQMHALGEALLEPGKQYSLRPSEHFRLHRIDVLGSTGNTAQDSPELGTAEFFCIPSLYFTKKFNHRNGLGQPHSEVAYFKAYYSSLHPEFGKRSLQVLDLGCGRGRNAVLFAGDRHNPYSVLGLDQNPQSLAAWNDMVQTENMQDSISMTSMQNDLNTWRQAPEHDIAMAIVSLQFLQAQAAVELLLHCMEKGTAGALHLAVFPIVSQHPNIVWPSSFDFLPQSQEIKNFYVHNNWSILEYRESYGHLGRAADGLPLRGLFATLIAQKAH